MSNAMRSGKRVLAGLAAGALGAGVLTLVAAPAAQAGAASVIAFDSPSMTIVGTALATKKIAAGLNIYDSAGDLADDTTNRSVRISMTAPATADDDSVGFITSGDDTSILQTVTGTALNNLPTMTVAPRGIAATTWDTVLNNASAGAGTYTLRAGMVISVEPPVFIGSERLGARLVDNVLITQDGAEVLSNYSRDLIVVADQ